MSPSSTWRLLRDGSGFAADGPTNMAIDRALLEAVGSGAPPTLRLYRWDRPTLSFGRNQPARGLYDIDAAASSGIDFVRRPTGGQAVLHADELTYAVVAPVAVIGRPRDAYRRINETLAAGLRTVGVDAKVAGGGGRANAPRGSHTDPGMRTPAGTHTDPGMHTHTHTHTGTAATWAEACFRRAAAGEVVVGGRKLVGSAQRCEGRVILQHGSILVSGSQEAAERLLREPVGVAGADGAAESPGWANGDGGWTTLEAELAHRPAIDRLEQSLVAAWRESIGTALAPATLTVEEATRARELRVRFASPEWTWRR